MDAIEDSVLNLLRSHEASGGSFPETIRDGLSDRFSNREVRSAIARLWERGRLTFILGGRVTESQPADVLAEWPGVAPQLLERTARDCAYELDAWLDRMDPTWDWVKDLRIFAQKWRKTLPLWDVEITRADREQVLVYWAERKILTPDDEGYQEYLEHGTLAGGQEAADRLASHFARYRVSLGQPPA